MREELFTLLDVPIQNVTMEQALEQISSCTFPHEGPACELHFVNAHCINVSANDEGYRRILQSSDAVYADGSGIRKAGRIMGVQIADNVNGTDMFPLLCRRMQDEQKRIYLLGAAPGTAEKVRDWVGQEIGPGVIAGVHDGFFEETELDAVLAHIQHSGADLLLVALGVPRQELWIRSVRDRLPVAAAMGVGGLFDFYSGNIPRAPRWLRAIGFEWVWRLIQEPRRMWKRYLIGNLVFLRRVHTAQRKGSPS
jgi:N-acetylglucosaminyldiphosphoundecaprenol N-acetyl-beta-D-mannosaminyltransferase